MSRLREALITEAERAQICISVGDHSSKVYEAKLAAKQANNNNNIKNVPQTAIITTTLTSLLHSSNSQQSINVSSSLDVQTNITTFKNEQTFNNASAVLQEFEIQKEAESLTLVNELLSIHNESKNIETLTDSIELEDLPNIHLLPDITVKLLSHAINESKLETENNSTIESSLNSEPINVDKNKLNERNGVKIEEKKVNKTNLLQLEIGEAADVFDTNETHQQNTIQVLSYTSTSLPKVSPLLSKHEEIIVGNALIRPLAPLLESHSRAVTFEPFTRIAAFTQSSRAYSTQRIAKTLPTVRPSFNVNVVSNKGTFTLSKQSSQLKSRAQALPVIPTEEKKIISKTSTTSTTIR